MFRMTDFPVHAEPEIMIVDERRIPSGKAISSGDIPNFTLKLIR